MMVGTYANGWLVQLRHECCRDRYMKPLKEDQQPQSTLSCCVALLALNPKSLREEEGALMQATIEVSRRAAEKCFS